MKRMGKKARKYIYLSNKDYDGTVYKTQVLDWLHLFEQHGVKFDLIQLFHITDFLKKGFVSNQISKIKKDTHLIRQFSVFFPLKGIFVYLNVILFIVLLLRDLISFREILIFSRGMFGKEMKILKSLFPNRIIFYYDARAASAEENKYIAIKQGDFSYRKYKTIAHVNYTEFCTVSTADKIFVVSDVLKEYFVNSFQISPNKFQKYPCLSDSAKFFYDLAVRDSIRNQLMITDTTKVFLYAGGIGMDWHLSDKMFAFFDYLNNHSKNLHFLFLTKDDLSIAKMLLKYPGLKGSISVMSVDNQDMYKYLNAADYGILFRENTVMNNVASPTKFAEYVLCGLPTIISEGVGDYSKFCVEHKIGIQLSEQTLNTISDFDVDEFLKVKFNRENISEVGFEFLAKQSIIDDLVNQMTHGS